MNQLVGENPPPSQPAFTEKKGQYLAFIWAYTQINARAPSERDMQRFFAVTPPSVHQMILTLERQGLIQRKPATARTIELLISPEILPVLRSPQISIGQSVARAQDLPCRDRAAYCRRPGRNTSDSMNYWLYRPVAFHPELTLA